MRGGSVAASVIERVRVFDNRESAKSIVVANTEISNPPIAPSGLGVLSRTAESIVFGWTDNSNTETDFEFWNGSSWITGIVAGTTQYSVLASSVSTTVNTTFSVRAVNSFGSTANSDYVFIPVTFDANGATEGSVPTAQTKIPDSTLTLAANTGNLARTGYTFAGWNTASGGTGTDYAVSSSYTANVAVILYAKWVANTASLTLSLANPLEPAVTFSGGTLSINRAVNGSITVTVSDGSYTYYQWTIAGQGPVPVLGTNGGESITIATQSGTTNLATFTVTLFFGNGSPDHSKSFSIQVVEE
jgi:uncharacterized repeat protein (TIGR02543 family)